MGALNVVVHKVSEVRMVLATKADAEAGLYAYVSFRIGLLFIDGVTLRRTLGGDLRLSYPTRRSRLGRDYPLVRPLDDAARCSIEAQVFDQLDLTEVTP